MYIFIMLLGGWSFNKELESKKPVTWNNADAISTLIWGSIIYFIFLMTSNMNLKYNLTLYALLFLLYFTNTQRTFYITREVIGEKFNKNIVIFELFVVVISIMVLIYGNYKYYLYKKKEYKKKFSIIKFIFGGNDCKGL